MKKVKAIKLKYKVKNIFPHGDCLVPIISKRMINKKIKMEKEKLTNDELLFLAESNKIERESGEIGSVAMDDAIVAWKYAKKEFKKNDGKISIPFILAIHKRLAKNIRPDIAGHIRDVPVYIGGECRDQTYDEIINELNALCERWNNRTFITRNDSRFEKYEKNQKELFVKSWHIGYEHVHSFEDFNGRSGRILINLQRLWLGLPILIIHTGKEQYEYYKWFQEPKTHN
jgi:fido (protein-threonine AMPylation protein)